MQQSVTTRLCLPTSVMAAGGSKGWNKPRPAQMGVERHREAQRGVVVVQIPSSGGVMSVGAGYGMAQIWRKIGVVVALFKGANC
jgi:hypothetical protein